MEDRRSFKLEKSSFEPEGTERKSRYIHKVPMTAGKKAARVAFRNHPKKGDTVYLKLVEITRNSNNDEFYYKATKVPTSKKRKFGDTTVNVGYEYHITHIKPEEFEKQVA